jgi:hypothetical protein
MEKLWRLRHNSAVVCIQARLLSGSLMELSMPPSEAVKLLDLLDRLAQIQGWPRQPDKVVRGEIH